MACHHWKEGRRQGGILGGWQRWWSIQQLVDVSIAWTAEAASSHRMSMFQSWPCQGQVVRVEMMKDIQKSLYFGEVICEWSSAGDMWTINNFHLGLKLCEATSHMAGQREWEIFCGAVSFSPFFTLHSRNTWAPLQMRHLQAATLKVRRGGRLVDLWFGMMISAWTIYPKQY